MTTMAIIEKCRERLQEIPELQKKLSQTEQSAHSNAFRLENLAKEQAILSQIMEVVNANESALPKTIQPRTSNDLREVRLKAYASVPGLHSLQKFPTSSNHCILQVELCVPRLKLHHELRPFLPVFNELRVFLNYAWLSAGAVMIQGTGAAEYFPS